MADVPQTPGAPPILSYANELPRSGVVWRRDGDTLRIIVPPVPSWRELSIGFYIGGGLLGFVVLVLTICAFSTPPALELIPGLAFNGAALAAVIYAALYRLHRRLIFELTPRELRVRSSMPPRTRHVWPRDQIVEIKLNRSDGSLVIRASGREMQSLYIGPRREVVEWVAQRLNEALSQAPADAAPAAVEETSAPPGVSRLMRTVLLILSASMAVAGIVMLFFGSPWVIIGVYLLIAASGPVGIALGTQEREYYV